jgi:hypothetical protein
LDYRHIGEHNFGNHTVLDTIETMDQSLLKKSYEMADYYDDTPEIDITDEIEEWKPSFLVWLTVLLMECTMFFVMLPWKI